MKARIIFIALVIATLLVAGLGKSQVLGAVWRESPAETAKAPFAQSVSPTVVLEETKSLNKEAETTPVAPGDPYSDKQWVLNEFPVLASTPTAEVIIAVLDTGIDEKHKDLAGKVVDSIDFSESKTVTDVNGHGTHVAGIIAATVNNGIGVSGIVPKARLLNVKVADDNGMVWSSTVAKGIIWAVDKGAKVINMSLVTPTPSAALEQAVDYAWSRGVVLVAGAGNNIKGIPVYPASYPEVMAVATTDSEGSLWAKSNYGNWVDAYAPGVDILSTLPGNKYGYKSGTSMATAYVTGVAALALTTVTDVNNNGFVNDEVAALLETLLPMPK